MSDRPQGDGWWLAADGRWYPPESRPGEPLPPPPTGAPAIEPRQLSKGLTYATFGVLVGTGVLYLAYTVATVVYLINFDGSGSVTAGITAQSDQLLTGEDVYFLTLALAGLATVACAGMFITWCHLAYRAAASRGASGNSWSPGWAIGAWFIPLANMVLPRLVLGEVERMSHESSGPPPIVDRWRQSPVDPLGRAWWIVFVAAYLASSTALTAQGFSIDDSVFKAWVAAEAVAGGLYVIAAGLGAVYVLKIGRRLGGR